MYPNQLMKFHHFKQQFTAQIICTSIILQLPCHLFFFYAQENFLILQQSVVPHTLKWEGSG